MKTPSKTKLQRNLEPSIIRDKSGREYTAHVISEAETQEERAARLRKPRRIRRTKPHTTLKEFEEYHTKVFKATNGLFPVPHEKLPGYQRADSSATIPLLRIGVQSARKYPLEDQFLQSIEEHSGKLEGIERKILEALKSDDLAFFECLARAIKRVDPNRYGKASFLENSLAEVDPYKDCAGLISVFWVDGLLWLMTDSAIRTFFQFVLNKAFTVDAIRKARRDRRLWSHPGRPIYDLTLENGRIAVRVRKNPDKWRDNFCQSSP